MIPKGEEVEFQISVTNRNFLHEIFHMEASQNFLFSLFKSVDASCKEGKGTDAFCEQGKGDGSTSYQWKTGANALS